MSVIDPFLFSGPAQIKEYQNSRKRNWMKMKETSEIDFNHYFKKIKEKWNLDITDELDDHHTEPKGSDNPEDQDPDSTLQSAGTLAIDDDMITETINKGISDELEISSTTKTISRKTESINKNELEAAGVYIPEEADAKMIGTLTEEEERYIELISLLEWNMHMMGRRKMHKSSTKSKKRRKSEQKKSEMEDLKFQAMLEAKNLAKMKADSKRKKA